MSKGNILLVEDDGALAELLKYHLTKSNFSFDHTPSGDDALLMCADKAPDLILLDWMIEGTSGIEVCRRLRRRPLTASTPILMLSARGEEEDRIRGLETGADDYISKPFSIKEVLARIEAVLRRVRPEAMREELRYSDIVMDLAQHKVTRNGRPVVLGPTEFRLLREFMESPRRVFSRERLLETVWRHDLEINLRTVDVQIRRLRKALNVGDEVDLIRTVRAAGYALDVEPDG